MTDAARSDENTETRITKSNRSRNVIYDSGGHLSPTIHGGIGGASGIRRSMGTTAVVMIPNTRILQVPSYVNMLTTTN